MITAAVVLINIVMHNVIQFRIILLCMVGIVRDVRAGGMRVENL